MFFLQILAKGISGYAQSISHIRTFPYFSMVIIYAWNVYEWKELMALTDMDMWPTKQGVSRKLIN